MPKHRGKNIKKKQGETDINLIKIKYLKLLAKEIDFVPKIKKGGCIKKAKITLEKYKNTEKVIKKLVKLIR